MASTAAAYAAAQGFIDAQAAAAGADARLSALADLHRRRLWNQLTQAVLELVRDPAAAAPGGVNLVQVRRGGDGPAVPAAGGTCRRMPTPLFYYLPPPSSISLSLLPLSPLSRSSTTASSRASRRSSTSCSSC